MPSIRTTEELKSMVTDSKDIKYLTLVQAAFNKVGIVFNAREDSVYRTLLDLTNFTEMLSVLNALNIRRVQEYNFIKELLNGKEISGIEFENIATSTAIEKGINAELEKIRGIVDRFNSIEKEIRSSTARIINQEEALATLSGGGTRLHEIAKKIARPVEVVYPAVVFNRPTDTPSLVKFITGIYTRLYKGPFKDSRNMTRYALTPVIAIDNLPGVAAGIIDKVEAGIKVSESSLDNYINTPGDFARALYLALSKTRAGGYRRRKTRRSKRSRRRNTRSKR